MIYGFEKELMLSVDDCELRIKEEGLIEPYIDPKLKKCKSEYEMFIAELFMQHIVSFSPNVRERAGIFFVRKRMGNFALS